MKTFVLKEGDLKPEWWIVDATDLVVGRLAAKLAPILLGKHKPTFTPHMPGGDFVVVINAEKVKFTGRKWADKEYDRYTGYPSGRRVVTAGQMRDKAPEQVVKLAVRRMLPKTKLGYKILTQLKIYAGTEHPHSAQQPKPLKLEL